MCEIYIDDPPDLWQETKRKARKDHKCSSCYRTIRKGEIYLVHFSVNDGTSWNAKLCHECESDRETFAKAHEGVLSFPSGILDMLEDCIEDGDEESENVWQPIVDRICGVRQANTSLRG